MRILKISLVLSLFTIVQTLEAQNRYPQGYFRNPLNIPISLSGNFGELRPNHYHMGLDLKTNTRENLPVYATADGYVGRIKIEPGGFGRAIYIYHPNGYTTLYAHLNAFSSKIETYLRGKQYELESWNLTLEIPEGVLPVKKGEFIANSGNTGGSQGPHLHFEIRRTETDLNLNPILFGFPIPDNTAPNLQRLAIYDRTKSVYEQSARLIPLKSTGQGRYTTSPAIITVGSPKISLAFSGYDTHTGSANANGIYSAELEVDGVDEIAFFMDEISYNDTRYMNAHIDYRLKSRSGPYVQHLSELPGYLNSIYHHRNGNGILDLTYGSTKEVFISVKDAAGNRSVIQTRIKYSGTTSTGNENLPGKMFYPFMIDGFESDSCEFYIGEKALYDSVRIAHSKKVSTQSLSASSVHTIGAPHIPLQEAFLIRILPSRALSQAEKDRTVMRWSSGSKNSVQKVEWQMDWAGASFRDFGSYELLVDNEPPVIVPIGFSNGADLSKASRLVFTVRDNLGKFKNVRAELNGKWLMFTNDKGRNFIYSFDEKFPRGKNELRISAQDEAGNITTETYSITR